jgi:hypothetical protein
VSRQRKEKEKTKDGEQYERFLKKAKEIGANDDEAFEGALGKILKAKPEKRKQDKKGNGEAPSV